MNESCACGAPGKSTGTELRQCGDIILVPTYSHRTQTMNESYE